MRHPQPRIVVSRCLGFEHCRYNGDVISSDVVDALSGHVEYVPVCAEVEIGLGVPRNPVRLVRSDGETHMVQRDTLRDVTMLMDSFSETFVASVGDIDGCILKGRSPSCGLRDAKAYGSIESPFVLEKTSGLFARTLMDAHPTLAMEDELRLKNIRIREHFLTKVFTHARYREMAEAHTLKDLIAFHTQNKYLFMAYHQNELREMGRAVANQHLYDFDELLDIYRGHLDTMFASPPRPESYINVMEHMFGYFSRELSARERAHFLSLVKEYREGLVPLSALRALIVTWALRFEDDYVLEQTVIEPYPNLFVDPQELYRQRDYWKA